MAGLPWEVMGPVWDVTDTFLAVGDVERERVGGWFREVWHGG